MSINVDLAKPRRGRFEVLRGRRGEPPATWTGARLGPGLQRVGPPAVTCCDDFAPPAMVVRRQGLNKRVRSAESAAGGVSPY